MRRTLTVRLDPDGVLRLPLGETNANKIVRVVVEMIPQETTREERLRFIEEMAGKIDDPTFRRHPQCMHEEEKGEQK